MDNITKIDNLTRVTRRRDFEDGLMDFVFAVTFLFLGGLGGVFLSPLGLRWYFTSLLWNREVTIIAGIVLVFLFILIVFGARRLIVRIRRKTLWKNRGFVTPLRWQVSWQINALASGVLIVMLVIAFWLMLNGSIGQESVLRTLVSSAGVATGFEFFWDGKRTGIGTIQMGRCPWWLVIRADHPGPDVFFKLLAGPWNQLDDRLHHFRRLGFAGIPRSARGG